MTDADCAFLEDVTSALTFEARGHTLGAAFEAAAAALLQATVEDPAVVRDGVIREVRLAEPDLELLLLAFLNELVYLRDAEGLLLRARRIDVQEGPDGAELRAELAGETLDRDRHALASEVKAATAHGLRVAREAGAWRVRVTLDV